MGILEKFFGTKNDRVLKLMQPRVDAINALEPDMANRDDAYLKDRILNLKKEISGTIQALDAKNSDAKKEDYNKILDPHLNEVFAIVREASKRTLNMRHFDVQLIGGMALHEGKIAEMRTGEGKTLMSTLPIVLNALAGKGVHLVTVNDYLASRDAEWMARIYRFLGLTVGVIIPQSGEAAKKEAYQCDITYGQNNEFGFDYLRDNMKFSLEDYVQRDPFFAVVDEVDSILIDEARTPLIISGPTDEKTDKYEKVNALIPKLQQDVDFTIDEKSRSVLLTEKGVRHSEKLFGIENLYDPNNVLLLHHLNQALRAHALYKRDRDYVIERGQVVIVDEHTGRLMQGRRWSDGLHQAVEAKERVRVEAENQTLATITFQNYFRMYKKLSGMTGTADTEAEEFAKIYDLDVLVIPTNKPLIRDDQDDLVYKSEEEKTRAIAKDITEAHRKGQPVLVGTVSVEKSEVLSRELRRNNVPHNVLNAKRHKDEAYFVAQAGKPGAVTIATNMAGRGTDIVLGGNAEFLARQKVAEAMGHTAAQVAEFGYLTGKPELIDAKKMAQADTRDPRYYQALHAKQSSDEAAEASAAGNSRLSLEEAEKKIFDDRLAYYQKAIGIYAEEIARQELESRGEKEKVIRAGGMRIIGTERHESRRIDNQLRGRAGRQGDPGSSCFYLSLQDDLMRVFGSERMFGLMNKLGMEDDEPIEHPWVSKSIANAQKRVEGQHFDSRKQVIEYDDVMNQQRKSVYGLRRKILDGAHMDELILDLIEEAVVSAVEVAAPGKTNPSEWKLQDLAQSFETLLGVGIDLDDFSGDRDDLLDRIFSQLIENLDRKKKKVGANILNQVEMFIYLQTIDRRWKEHLSHMDHLREGIHFRGYAQKDPKQEYKKEGYNLFLSMMALIRDETLEKIFKAEIRPGTGERIEQDLSELRAKAKAEAERQMKMRALQEGLLGPAPGGPRMGNRPAGKGGPGGPMGAPPPPGLNRAQRRMMKSKQKNQDGR